MLGCELDVWYTVKADGITHKMFHCFEEDCEGSLCTASVKVKFSDSTESNWYHPPKVLVDTDVKPEWLFPVEEED